MVQAYSERLSPSIYFNVTQTSRAKEKFKNDINLHLPNLIAIPLFSEYTQNVDRDIRSFIDGLIEKNYYFDRCMFGYGIYRLRPLKPPPVN
jgi:hypothetical protein